MKKRNLNGLKLNKLSISSLHSTSVKGGDIRSGNTYCTTFAFKCSLAFCYTVDITCPIEHSTSPAGC